MQRRCLDCRTFIENTQPRCTRCTKNRNRAKNAGRNSTLRISLRKQLFIEGGARCAKCGNWRQARSLELDHVMPLAAGGPDEAQNTQWLCKPCHREKTYGTELFAT